MLIFIYFHFIGKREIDIVHVGPNISDYFAFKWDANVIKLIDFYLSVRFSFFISFTTHGTVINSSDVT